MNPYTKCPEFETDSFTLRLVRPSDAEELLGCYSDPEAVKRVNADCCTTDFNFTELEQMEECIDFWLEEYERRSFVRFSIIPKTAGRAAGTLEIFGGSFNASSDISDTSASDAPGTSDASDFGVLRIDLYNAYWTDMYFEEIIRLVVLTMIPDYRIFDLKIKTSNIPDKTAVLEKYGFVPSKTFRPESGYYERVLHTHFCPDKGIAFCGLACCVCSENTGCTGCRQEGCRDKEWCRPYRCCKDRKLNGCWECTEFPCDNPMLNKPRIRTFAELADKYGENALVEALGKNESAGLQYHFEGQLTGDYDLAEDRSHITQMVFRDKTEPL